MIRPARCLAVATVMVTALLWSPFATGHEVRPGYLEIREIEAGAYDMLWKVPARGNLRLGLYVRLPERCTRSEPYTRMSGGAFVERWQARCNPGIFGDEIRIDGLADTRTDVLARVVRTDGGVQTTRLTPDSSGFVVEESPSWMEVATAYLGLGVEHILLGIDHLLFVLALMFLVTDWRRLLWTITAFTLAHSLTLGAATVGWIHVPQAPVEAVIALSIMFVASEILHARQGKAGIAVKKPWLVAMVFGLLHGLGFAGALSEIGVPENAIPLALLFFNLGVEAGQILFVAAVLGVLALLGRMRAPGPGGGRADVWRTAASLAVPVAYLVGSLAAFWVIERTVGFWS